MQQRSPDQIGAIFTLDFGGIAFHDSSLIQAALEKRVASFNIKGFYANGRRQKVYLLCQLPPQRSGE